MVIGGLGLWDSEADTRPSKNVHPDVGSVKTVWSLPAFGVCIASRNEGISGATKMPWIASSSPRRWLLSSLISYASKTAAESDSGSGFLNVNLRKGSSNISNQRGSASSRGLTGARPGPTFGRTPGWTADGQVGAPGRRLRDLWWSFVDAVESSYARQLQSLAVGDDSSNGAELRGSRDLAS